jgi:hypothetical protein
MVARSLVTSLATKATFPRAPHQITGVKLMPARLSRVADPFFPPIAPKTHLSNFLAERYALGRITSEHQLDKVEDHIRQCDECRKRVEKVDAVRDFKKALSRLRIQ